ncbi:MAG: FtsQ-type POTRA domain-containing protein [Patescibacteria group bacterium]
MPKTQSAPSSKQLSASKKHILHLGAIICVMVFTVVSIYSVDKTFKIKTVKINKGSSSMGLKGLNIFSNTNLLLLDEKKSANLIYKENSYIKDITVKKQLPSTVQIAVRFFQPSAQIEVSEGNFILSSNARILKKTKDIDRSLPMIHYYQKLSYNGYKAGDLIPFKDIRASLAFFEKAKDLGLTINRIDINGFNMIALSTENQKVTFSLEKSEKDQLYQFERVVHQFKIQGKEFKTLDLRFERVIIGQ